MGIRTLKTEAGSTVTIHGLYGEKALIEFDWFEENNACIDCEVDVDLSHATGWKTLIWRCEVDENHDLAYAKLHRFNPNKDAQPVWGCPEAHPMTFNFQWCKKHRKPNPLESAFFCPGCTLESVDEATRFRKALEQIRDLDDSGKWTDFSITLQHIAAETLGTKH